jgi:hypothetical protein
MSNSGDAQRQLHDNTQYEDVQRSVRSFGGNSGHNDDVFDFSRLEWRNRDRDTKLLVEKILLREAGTQTLLGRSLQSTGQSTGMLRGDNPLDASGKFLEPAEISGGLDRFLPLHQLGGQAQGTMSVMPGPSNVALGQNEDIRPLDAVEASLQTAFSVIQQECSKAFEQLNDGYSHEFEPLTKVPSIIFWNNPWLQNAGIVLLPIYKLDTLALLLEISLDSEQLRLPVSVVGNGAEMVLISYFLNEGLERWLHRDRRNWIFLTLT